MLSLTSPRHISTLPIRDGRLNVSYAQLPIMRRWRGERGERHFNEGAAQGYLAQRLQGLDTAFDAFGSGGLSVD